jgi:hypothetical protein
MGDQFGLGDTVQSLFFSPREPGPRGWIWGVGPALLLPTATEDVLGADQWGAGPTGVVLKQQGPWTYGLLSQRISFGGGLKVYADAPVTAPAWGIRTFITLLYPR